MKRILGGFFVLGLSISTLAFNLPVNAQSAQGSGTTGEPSGDAGSDVGVFENPTEGNNIPVDAAIKGADGRSPRARQQGANAFCQSNGYTQALEGFQYKRGSTIGTMQWDPKTNSWEFCANCGMYLTKVRCK